MNLYKGKILSVCASALFACGLYAQESISSGGASVQIADGANVSFVSSDGAKWSLKPEFTVFFSQKNPSLKMNSSGLDKGILYNVPTWERLDLEKKYILKTKKASDNEIGDGFEDSIIRSKSKGRTANVWVAAPSITVSATSAKVQNNEIVFDFPKNDDFSLSAKIYFSKDSSYPIFEFDFSPKKDGYYSCPEANSRKCRLPKS